ncbi:MAG TPA: hypothetical protein VFV27_12035 [Nevskiaceae bacterium]|nr:hypothetical protein [Nevskiaceae bacterium]
MTRTRRNHYDVTDRVRISHPDAVCSAVLQTLRPRFPGVSEPVLRRAFDTFARLYAGVLPGYVGCDTWYHDAQHSLDCALAMARLLDGHDRSVGERERLGDSRALLGVVIALFHDAGYIRREDDPARNGAEYTLNHVHRSGEFLGAFLPSLGLGDAVALTRQVVHFTGYEIALDKIQVPDPRDRTLGFLLGTADILAQTSDRCYLEKCRDFLFREFRICGLAGTPGSKYPTVEALLSNTPEFNQQLWEDRLDGYFRQAYRYMEAHFGGHNPYVEQIQAHLKLIATLARQRRLDRLTKRPSFIGAEALRRQLGLSRDESLAVAA